MACSEYQVHEKTTPDGAFDTGNPVVPPIDSQGETGHPQEVCDGIDNNEDGQVDEGFPDSDSDGYADCIEQDCTVSLTNGGDRAILEECQGSGGGGVVTDPWNATIEWQYNVTSGSGVIVMPAIGNMNDDNGDGRVDDNDIPDIAFSTWTSNTLVVLSGDNAYPVFY